MDPGLSDFQLHSDFHQGIYVTQGLRVCVRVCAHVIRERETEGSFSPSESVVLGQ